MKRISIIVCHALLSAAPALAAAPGGLVERASDANLRPGPSGPEVAGFLPARGAFQFPAPYGTRGVRLTNADDCGGGDCVNYGYSYWRNINNHRGQREMLIFVGLDAGRGGTGPTLFAYDKTTHALRKVGPLFDAGSPYRARSGEGWYWSAMAPTVLYLHDGPRLLRYDVTSRHMSTVFDVATEFGGSASLWQAHSSQDDRVHSATLKLSGGSAGCVVYDEGARALRYFAADGQLDECQVDRGGRWLLMKEDVDGANDVDNRVVDLATGNQDVLLDQEGGAGHSDNGFGYLLGEDNWAAEPGAIKMRRFDDLTNESLVYHHLDWSVGVTHVAHSNARSDLPAEEQFACASHMGPRSVPRANEIVCFRLDGSLATLVVAPTMVDSGASGGGDSYAQMPKANIDPTGEYMFWTSNMGSGRLDAFVVEVPWQKLVDERAYATYGGSGAYDAAGGCVAAPGAPVALLGLLALRRRRRRP